MNKAQQKKYLIRLFLLVLISIPFIGLSQTVGTTEPIDPPITGQGVFYASVYVSDNDGNENIDALLALSQGEMNGWGSLSCIVRWNSGAGGNVDAHDGNGYTSDTNNLVPIAFDSKYEVWFDVDVVAGTYTPYVKGPDMTDPVPVLTDVEFRAKGVASLNTWSAVRASSTDDGLDILTSGLVDAVGSYPASYFEAGIENVVFIPAGLNEAWDPEVTSYTATFPFATAVTEVSATPMPLGTSIAGTGTLDLSAGSGELNLVATSESGTVEKTYTIEWMVRNPEKDVSLNSLSIDVGDSVNFGGLVPDFAPTITEYAIEVPFGTKEVQINAAASAASEGATISGTGVLDVSSGMGIASIVVTSSDETTTQTYTVTVSVEKFGIQDLYIDYTTFTGTTGTTHFDAFEMGNYHYTVEVSTGAVSIANLMVETNDEGSVAMFPENLSFENGSETVEIKVFPEDLSETITYTITFKANPAAAAIEYGHFETPLTGVHTVYTKLAVPMSGATDVLFALSDGLISSYEQFSAGFRFTQNDSTLNPIELHNGGYTFAEGNPIAELNTVYYCWMVVDVPNGTYSLHVQKEGDASSYLVGENAVYRNADITSLDTWGAYYNGSKPFSPLDVMEVSLVDNLGDFPTKGSDATLSGISLSTGSISAFVPTTLEYAVNVPFGTIAVDVKAMSTDSSAFILGDGIIDLVSGTAKDSIWVFADDLSDTTLYTITFSETAENMDATLDNLSVNVGQLSPEFASSITSYNLSVPFGTSTVSLSAVTNVEGATVTGAGDISVGTGVVANVEVTAMDEISTETYSVTITPEVVSNDAKLAYINASIGEFDLAFDPEVTAYVLSLPFQTYSVTLRSIANQSGATVAGGGLIDMTETDEATSEIVVTAEDGTTTMTYTVDVLVIAASSDASLSGLSVDAGTLDPVFSAETMDYTLDVPYGTEMVNVTATSNHPGATVVGSGAIDVTSGSATATILVTAEDATSLTYTVEITVLPASTDATLANLFVEGGTTLEPTFDAAVLEYVSVIPLNTKTAIVHATLNDDLASLTGAGAIDVISGSGVANVVVTAEDGTTTTTYVVTIYVGAKPTLELGTEDQLENLVEMYPNPSPDYITLDLNDPKLVNGRVSILDLNGRVHYTKDLNGDSKSLILDITKYSGGTYLIHIDSGDHHITKRFVKK